MKLKSGLAFIIAAIAFGAQARDMNSIQQSGELKVGVPGDYAPLAFHNKAGELLGYDVDMAKDLGKRLGLKVRFVPTSWPTLSADLQADKFDIAMGGVTETAARAKDFALSQPVVPNGKIALANLEALRQKTADMMVTDLIEGVYYQSNEPGVFCVANETPFPGTASFKVYMMNKDNPQLLEKVNQWLASQDKNVLKQKWRIHDQVKP